MSGPSLSKDLHPQVEKWWKTGDASQLSLSATREGIHDALLACSSDERVVALTADLAVSTGLTEFAKRFPKRFVDVGVAEQSLAGIAAGLASEGFRPVMTSFAVFSPGRNWDFLRVQVAMSRLPVVIVGSHAGLGTGQDGATHQALEDVAMMRCLPNMTVISPADRVETAGALTYAATKRSGPTYLRVGREPVPLLFSSFSPHPRYVLQGGQESEVVIVTTGSLAWTALQAARELWTVHSIPVSVLQVSVLKPLETDVLLHVLKNKRVFTLEDHSIIGGLGSAVAECSASILKKYPLTMMGMESFGDTGSASALYKKFGLDSSSVVRRVVESIKLHPSHSALVGKEKNLKTPELVIKQKKVSVMVKKTVKKSPVKSIVKKLVTKKITKPSMNAFLDAWVKNHPQGWDHGAWLDLLSQLGENNYTYEPDKVGVYIEKQRRKFFGW